MASTSSHHPAFILSPHQQDLLFAALQSNSTAADFASNTIATDAKPVNKLSGSPTQVVPGSEKLNGFDDSPFIDDEFDFDVDGSFDYDFNNGLEDQMIGKLPGTSSDGDAAELHDKRSHPDDNENEEDGGGKRREGDEKGSKKPGRKPITAEPTSKRKAQNRAAQRAFRERKEKHLKDLETKVQDLEKASESANHENAMLRSKVEKMAHELKEYRKKLSLSGNANRSPSSVAVPPYLTGKGFGNTVNNPNDVNFEFEFPKFGKLPGPPVTDVASFVTTTSPPISAHRASNASNGGSISPLDQELQMNSVFGSFANPSSTNDTLNTGNFNTSIDMADFSGLFHPSILDTMSKEFAFEPVNNMTSIASMSSVASARGQSSTGHSTSYNSPSESSNSNNGPSSSCGTSPEPHGLSPHNQTLDGPAKTNVNKDMHTPSIDSITGTFKTGFTPGIEYNNFDWFAQQNGNQFDPQLFNDYREPQNNILAGNGLYDDSFFNEAINMPEFNSPFNAMASPAVAKKNLVAEIDDKLNADDEVVPGESAGQMLTCNNMWEKIQNCPSVQSGEIDMDQLCSQLQQKAKCSGEGPVIDEKDFKSVIKSMFPNDKPCPLTQD